MDSFGTGLFYLTMRGKIYSESEIVLHEHPNRPGFIDKTGEKIGRLTVVGYAGSSKERIALWFCRCECGNFTRVHKRSLEIGNTKSCGCLHSEGGSQATHGHTKNGKMTPEYKTWSSMMDRVSNPKNSNYMYYGGRGISVCERWLKFDKFFADMGERPDGMSIDRIDVNGNYEPSNCRWATIEEQNNNKRNTRHVSHIGKTQNCTQWEKELGLNKGSLYNRLKRGWTMDDAITKPCRRRSSDITITYEGKTKTVVEWQKELGLKSDTILSRMRIGWSIERIMTTPNKEKKSKMPKKGKMVDTIKAMSENGKTLKEISEAVDRDTRYVSSVISYIKNRRRNNGQAVRESLGQQ